MRETFKLGDGRVRWKSRVDEGDEAAPEDFIFLPMDAAAAYSDATLRFMLSAPVQACPR